MFASPDYRAGRLLVIVAWDEGTKTSIHVPLVVIGLDLPALLGSLTGKE